MPMPMSLVRYAAGIVLILGLVMLGVENKTGGYNVLRLLHVVAGFGLIGLYESSMARAKRAGLLSAQGRQLGTVGRISLTLALLIGLVLLAGWVFEFLTGGAFSTVMYIHAAVGFVSVILAVLVFLRAQTVTRQ